MRSGNYTNSPPPIWLQEVKVEHADEVRGHCSKIVGKTKMLYINSMLSFAFQCWVQREPAIHKNKKEFWIKYDGIGSVIHSVLFKFDRHTDKPKSVKIHMNPRYLRRVLGELPFNKPEKVGFYPKRVSIAHQLAMIGGDAFERQRGLTPVYIYHDRKGTDRRSRVCFNLMDGRHVVIMMKGQKPIYVKVGFTGTIEQKATGWNMDLQDVKMIDIERNWQSVKVLLVDSRDV